MGLIYARRGDGLGTRILTVFHARMLADYLGAPFKICWPPLGAAYFEHPHYLDLSEIDRVIADRHFFKTEAGLLGEIHDADLVAGLNLLLLKGPAGRRYAKADLLAHLASGDGIGFEAACRIVPDTPRVDATLQSYWREVNWTPHFLSVLAAFEATRPPGRETVTIHVRRGDMITMLREAELERIFVLGMEELVQRFAPLQTYADAIAAHGDCDIVVCAEDKATVDWFKARHGATRVSSTLDMDLHPTERTFLDIAVMARSSTVIAPPLSYFSLCGATVGGATLRQLPHDIRNAIPELFAIMDRGTRVDKATLQALLCATYGRILGEDAGLRVRITKAEAPAPLPPPRSLLSRLAEPVARIYERTRTKR